MHWLQWHIFSPHQFSKWKISWTSMSNRNLFKKNSQIDYKLAFHLVPKYIRAKIKIFLIFSSVRKPWKYVTACPCWASLSHLICLGMNTFPLWRNLQQGRLACYSGPSDFSRPCIFSPSTRPKSAPVSNTALICGEEPPNIPSLA